MHEWMNSDSVRALFFLRSWNNHKNFPNSFHRFYVLLGWFFHDQNIITQMVYNTSLSMKEDDDCWAITNMYLISRSIEFNRWLLLLEVFFVVLQTKVKSLESWVECGQKKAAKWPRNLLEQSRNEMLFESDVVVASVVRDREL